jgi:hypothetical protein
MKNARIGDPGLRAREGVTTARNFSRGRSHPCWVTSVVRLGETVKNQVSV